MAKRKPTYWMIRKSMEEGLFMSKDGGWTTDFSKIVICCTETFRDSLLKKCEEEGIHTVISIKCIIENA